MKVSTLVRRKMHAVRVSRELRSLEDRELNDLGIARADISSIAAEDAKRVIAD